MKVNAAAVSAQNPQINSPEVNSDKNHLIFGPKKELTPKEKQENEKKAINLLKNQGCKLTSNNDGTYILEDNLGHKSKITNLGLNENGGVVYQDLLVQIIDPSQKDRFERLSRGGEDSPADKEKYAKQAMNILKKAGYQIEDQGDGRYILTTPAGNKSLVNDFNIDFDGGAVWTVLPVALGNKLNIMFEEF